MRRMNKWLLGLLALGACATAGTEPAGEAPDAGSGSSQPDAPPPPPPDSSPVGPVTLQQTSDMTIGGGVPICRNGFGVVFSMGVYRVFPLAEHQVTGAFHVEKVTFAVQQSDGSPELTVKLGTYSGALDGDELPLGGISQLAQANVTVPDSAEALVEVPLAADVPAGSNVVVEIAADTTSLFDPISIFGATTSAETHLSYMRAAQCNDVSNDASTPLSLSKWGSGGTHVLINVTGTPR